MTKTVMITGASSGFGKDATRLFLEKGWNVIATMRNPQGRETRHLGVIVNISSMGGQITIPYGTLYHATKFAFEGLTEALRYELNPLGIQTKLIEPGRGNPNVYEVSEAIFLAATDGSEQLRYIVGVDTQGLIDAKREKGEDYQQAIAGHFGIWSTSI